MQKEASPCTSGDTKETFQRKGGGEERRGASSHNRPRLFQTALRQGEDEQAAEGRAHEDHPTSVLPPCPLPTRLVVLFAK